MTKDLTVGKESRVLWLYSIPLFISVIFQQLYNLADSMIAGRFAGEKALAAVGASLPITSVFLAVAVGSNIGCSVIISGFFGAKRNEDVKASVSTSVIACLISGAVFTVAGILLTPFMLHLMQTPANIFQDASLYLKIYIYGFLFLYIYNISTGVFTALGDSKTPLIFLICSSVGNVILDYVFVKSFHMGVGGVAWATFITQGIACVLAAVTMIFRLKTLKTTKKWSYFDKNILRKVCHVAIPSIFQQGIVSVGNIFIQSLVNGFGYEVIAGFSAAIKINTFCITAFSALTSGLTNFTAQNIGANKPKRVKKGYLAGITLGLIIALFCTSILQVFKEPVILAFLKDANKEALMTGVSYLKIVPLFYFSVLIKLMSDGVLRGAGHMGAFMISTSLDLAIRVILSYILTPRYGYMGIWYSWPIGWLLSTSVAFCFLINLFRKGVIIKKSERI